MIEKMVGVMSQVIKGRSAQEIVQNLELNADSFSTGLPSWFDEAFILAVEERMRRLLGHWNATAFGAALELGWVDSGAAA